MYDGRKVCVEIVQSLKDLSTPSADELDLDILEPTHVSVGWVGWEWGGGGAR